MTERIEYLSFQMNIILKPQYADMATCRKGELIPQQPSDLGLGHVVYTTVQH